MEIYKLPKNQWTKDGRKYKYYWNEKDKNGKWKKSFSRAYKTKLDAMNAEREFLNSKVEFGGDMDMTFGTLTDQYIESQKNKVRRRTMETYLKRRRYFTDFVCCFINIIKLLQDLFVPSFLIYNPICHQNLYFLHIHIFFDIFSILFLLIHFLLIYLLLSKVPQHILF